MVIQTHLMKMVACAFRGYNQPFLKLDNEVASIGHYREPHIWSRCSFHKKNTDISVNMTVVFAT